MVAAVEASEPEKARAKVRADVSTTDEDVDAAHQEIRGGRGWPDALRAVEARRLAAGVTPPTVTVRSLRRAFHRRGIVVQVPKVHPPHGHRPRKPPMTLAECKLAIEAAKVRGPNGGPNWKGAAAVVNAARGDDPRLHVSPRWIELQLRDRLEAEP